MTTKFQNPVAINHKGKVIYFVSQKGEDNEGDQFFYNVLSMQIENTSNNENWDGYNQLNFPEEVSLAGMNMLRVKKKVVSTGLFQVLTDQQYIYVIRSGEKSLYINRYLLVEIPSEKVNAATRMDMQPTWEVRFKDSGKPDTPAGEKDTQSYINQDGKQFIEPVFELPFGYENADLKLSKGYFSVNLMPTSKSDELRWQFFIADTDNNQLLSYNIARTEEGWFQFAKDQIDTTKNFIKPDRTIDFKLAGQPVKLIGPPSAVVYTKQEPVETSDSTVLELQQAYRMMSVLQLQDGSQNNFTATLDSAISRFGTLAYPSTPGGEPINTLPLGRVNYAPFSSQFNGKSWVQIEGDSIVLAGPYTQQVWIYPTARDTSEKVILGTMNKEVKAENRPPSIWIEDKYKIAVGFGNGSKLLKMTSKTNAFNTNSWNNIIAIFDNGVYTVLVNGSIVDLVGDDFAGVVPPPTPLDGIGGRRFGNFSGEINEVKIWSGNKKDDALKYMYERIPEEVAKEMEGLEVYFPLDKGKGTSIRNLSSNNTRKGTLSGATWVSSSSPLKPLSSPTAFVDKKGLTFYAGAIVPKEEGDFDAFGAIKEGSRPLLLSSSDGYVHLYYQGINDEFLVAHYDTSNSRAHFGVNWEAVAKDDKKTQSGLLVFSSKQTGTTFNHSKIEFNLDAASKLFQIVLNDNQGASETWNGIPGNMDYIVDVLSGYSISETTDPRLSIGERFFFDYQGERNQHFQLVDKDDPFKGKIQLVSRNVREFVFDTIKVTEGNSPNTCDVELSINFDDSPRTGTFGKKLKNVSREIEEFVKTVNGSSSVYDYQHPDNTDHKEALFYNIPAGKQAVLVILNDTEISGVNFEIQDAINSTPLVPTCDVKITLSFKSSDDLQATWEGIPRKSEDFINAIIKDEAPDRQKVAKLLTFYEKSKNLEVQNNEITKPASLYAATSFLDIFMLKAKGDIQPFTAKLGKIQCVDSEGEAANLKVGSLLFGVFPNGAPDNGFSPAVVKSQSGILLQPGRDGGWIAVSPRHSVAIDSPRSGIKIPKHKILTKALELPGSLTIESWVNINSIKGTRNLNDLSYPRIIHTNRKEGNNEAQYMMGTTYSTSLKFLQEEPNKPAQIIISNENAKEEKSIFGNEKYSFGFYMKPDIATAIQGGGYIFSLNPKDSNYPVQRMMVKDDAHFYFEWVENGNVILQKKSNNKLPDKEWSSITMTRSGNQMSIYFNGKEDQTFTLPDIATPYPGKSELVMGNNLEVPFQMEMNQIAVWNRNLQSYEVKDRFNMALPPDDEGLILLYRLDAVKEGDDIKNDAAITGSIYDKKVTGKYIWSFPGVFCPVYLAVRNKAVITEQALLSTSAWNHVAGIYSEHYGIQLSKQAYGDCGNEGSLNVDTGLSIEAWIIQTERVPGSNQVIFSKYGNELSEQSYEFGIDGNSKPFINVKISGRTTGEESKDPAPESDLYFTATGGEALELNKAYYLAATIDIKSEVKEISEKKSVNEFTLYGQLYVNGRPSGVQLTSPKMYGDIAINQTTSNANIGRTKPDGLTQDQQYYSGKISDLRLWKSPLSAADIKNNYEMVSPAISGESLISAWYFSEQQGRTAFDNESENNALLSNRDLWFLYLDNSQLFISINGRMVPVKPINISTLDGYSEPQIMIGNMLNENEGYTNLLDGSIDDLRIWSEVRTLEQIKDNKERPLTGREKKLAGYWRFQDGSGQIIYDQTGKGNDGDFFRFSPTDKYPAWKESDAPISNEAGIVINALGGKETHFSKSIVQGVAVVEYANSQYNFKRELFSIYKRCYIYIDQNHVVQRENNFKIGDLNQIFLGQVQSKPSLIGFIEGAPPLPSENLTMPYYNSATGYLHYSNSASVTLTEAEDTTISFSANRKDGSHLSFGIKGGFAFDDQRKVPVMSWNLSKINFKIGIASTIDWSTSKTEQSGSSYGLSKLTTNKLSNSGAWEKEDGDWEKFTKERRFIPSNIGYALVVSRTADMYALYLESTGAMVGFTVVPNLDIPPDKNIIYFPINPKYTKNGTLDGKVGLLTDKDFPNADIKRDSYFKPVEAYTLKQKIEKKEMDLLSYYDQFNAIDRGQSQQIDPSGIEADNPIYNFEEGRPRTDLVNNYVWTSAGGLYSEKESAMSVRQESHSGAYSFKWALGLTSEGKFMFGFGSVLGAYYNLSLMGGTDFTVNVQKSITSSNKFSLDVVAIGDGFLKAFINKKELLYSEEDMPGKVNAYRFMSFYLSPDRQNFTDFFDKSKGIVDQKWLYSDNPMAAALREAAANPNPVWRILHRVTYVSRIPPEFNPFPLDTNAPPLKKPANLIANRLMIQLVEKRILEGSDLDDCEANIQEYIKKYKEVETSEIGLAVRDVIYKDLINIIPWWSEFLIEAEVDNSDEQNTLTAFIFDSITYMTLYYATLNPDVES